MDKLQLFSYSSQYVFVCIHRMAAGMGVVGWRSLNEKSSQLCCQLWVDWPPGDEGEELLSIERQNSSDSVGEHLQVFECYFDEPLK